VWWQSSRCHKSACVTAGGTMAGCPRFETFVAPLNAALLVAARRVSEMGGAGNLPALVGYQPTGTEGRLRNGLDRI